MVMYQCSGVLRQNAHFVHCMPTPFCMWHVQSELFIAENMKPISLTIVVIACFIAIQHRLL